ncbi:RNA polymerase-binding protein DksA [Hydrogenophaga sp.]|uniref:RNA polymerase-binding protein DksA n=1 Tax=Hydrogenophaga sp. TaxID=1904254 RepID=UPI003522E6A9
MPVARRSSMTGARQRLSPGSGQGITSHPSATPTEVDAAQPRTPDPDQAPSGTERRPVVKAPATKSAKSAKPATSGTKGRTPAAKAVVSAAHKPAAKSAVKPTKAVTKASSKPAVKTAAKLPVKATAKPVARAPAKPKVPAPSKKTASPPAKAASKPVGKPIVAIKPTPSRTPAVKPIPASTAKSKAQPAAKAAVPTVTSSAPRAASAAPVSKVASAKRAPAPAPVVVEPTPRPLGKRAAKKVMMEQMTQAAVVPTHAPDAAKATFSHMNERAVMTPPVPSSIQKDPKRANNWKTLPADQLTDQDVQAMPDSEYMSDLQLAYFRRKLSQLKADMLANAGETTEHLREDTVVVPDPADRATIEEEHALELRTRDRERKLLKKIEQAIVRIDSGDYGYCEETGEPIGVGRLMARPTASLSLEAQQRRELKQKMFGD